MMNKCLKQIKIRCAKFALHGQQQAGACAKAHQAQLPPSKVCPCKDGKNASVQYETLTDPLGPETDYKTFW